MARRGAGFGSGKEIFYEILPYSPRQADRIIRHLCALAAFDPGQASDDPARAHRVRQAFSLIADAACARQALLDLEGRIGKAPWQDREAVSLIVDAALDRQALLDLDAIESRIGKAPWRDRLRDLRHDRSQFASAIGDKGARIALRWALVDIGQATRAGPRWLHFLRDHPPVLRKTIERALEAPLLRADAGRTDLLARVLLVEGVARAHEPLTGRPLGRSVTSETKSRPEGVPTGPGVRLVWICLEPLDPHVTDHGVVWAIRRAKRRQRP